MVSTTILLFGLVIGVSCFLVVMQLVPEAQPSLLQKRLENVASLDPVELDEIELQKPLSERVIAPLMGSVGRFMLRRTKAGQIQQLRLQILQAGSDMRPEKLLAQKVFAAIGFGLFAFAAVHFTNRQGAIAIAGPFGGVALGYFYPSSRLKGKVKKRAAEMRRGLPGVLDLLTISMEAGLSFDMALQKICETEEGIIAAEFQQVMNEVRLGRPRMEALTAMAERNAVDELAVFVRAVVQAEPLGVSVASVLRIQSEELRRIRKQRAEEAGHKAPVKMLIPMMGCIFPTIFIILLGPAALTIIASVSGGK
ncbi:MAG: type II secretion system F family protein [Candidatus Dormibacteria bacterium]